MQEKSIFEFAKARLWNIDTIETLPTVSMNDMIFKIWQYPSFTPYTMYCIAKRNYHYEIRRMTWSQTDNYLTNIEQMPKASLKYVEKFDGNIPDLIKTQIHKVFSTNNILPQTVTLDGIVNGIALFDNCRCIIKGEWMNGSKEMPIDFIKWFDSKYTDINKLFDAQQ